MTTSSDTVSRQTAVAAHAAFYIKLGRGGEWEAECLRDGVLRVDFSEVSHALCMTGDRDAVRSRYLEIGKKAGTATNFANRLREFYTAGPDTLWITFSQRKLWYGFADGDVYESASRDENGVPHKERRIRGGWRCVDALGATLDFTRLSSRLTKVASMQGTLCRVEGDDRDYLLAKINATPLPEVLAATEARDALLSTLVPLMAALHWRDFETLADLVFTAGGWRRTGAVGGIEKDIDLELEQPVTGDRIAVQVKSRCDTETLRAVGDIAGRYGADYKAFYLVTNALPENRPVPAGLTVLTGRRFAGLVLDAGLTDWLLRKAA